ncbi:MAG: single-stranded DNA-binding protein [Chitinophagaceae bacterium]|jgi:single-strand DNA-binding protein|nr:single-stranded DNA-binding protein [Chitinophagaceae bacterium]
MTAIKNKVQLIGYLGQPPEIKQITDGRKVAQLSLATNEHYKNPEGEKVTDTQWHVIVAWGKLADIAEKFLNKGTEIAVEGKLVYRTYTDKKGAKKNTTEIYANEILILSKKV